MDGGVHVYVGQATADDRQDKVPSASKQDNRVHALKANAPVVAPKSPQHWHREKIPRLTLFPLVRKLEVEEGDSIILDANVKVELASTEFKQPEWLRRCFSRVQLKLRKLAALAQSARPVARPIARPIASSSSGGAVLKAIKVFVPPSLTAVDVLNEKTNWNYSITCEQDAVNTLRPKTATCIVRSDGVYGAVTALQSTLIQIFSESGVAPVSKISIEDGSSYAVRGMMIDMGRRFVPKDVLLHEVIDGMALFRMNLLHLHLSDFCRFAIDLPGFPEFNKSLAGISEGQYSVREIAEIVEYARERGIMVLPEIDLPGHASGLLPLSKRGMQFCKRKTNCDVRPEHAPKVYDDPQGRSRRVLRELFHETHGIFNLSAGLNWFHVGGDEANPDGDCTKQNIVNLESFLVSELVGTQLGATAVAWEELRLKEPDENGFRAAGSSNSTIVIPWHMGNAHDIMERGHRAIAAYTINHYLDFDYERSPVEKFWYNISEPRTPRNIYDCSNASFTMHENKYLGEIAKAGPPLDLSEAKAECIKLANACAGVTCVSELESCQPRRGTPFLAPSSTGEFSYVKKCPGTKKDSVEKLLGAISAMWTDTYCYQYQCGAADPKFGAIPRGAVMYLRRFDRNFGMSLGGMIWPRAAVSAAAMWNYRSGLGTHEIRKFAEWSSTLLQRNGIATCPPGCTCDEISECGKPYAFADDYLDAKGLHACYLDKSEDDSTKNNLGPLARNKQWSSLHDAFLYCFWMGRYCVGVGSDPQDMEGFSFAGIFGEREVVAKMYRVFTPSYRGRQTVIPQDFFLKDSTQHCDPVASYLPLQKDANMGEDVEPRLPRLDEEEQDERSEDADEEDDDDERMSEDADKEDMNNDLMDAAE